MTMIKIAASACVAAVLVVGTASAEDKMKMDHGAMNTQMATEATGVGVIDKIDEAGGQVTVTHEPMPDVGWPKMTMDLPVTRRVDLSAIKPGAPINFKIKLGRDKKYRITEITPAE